MLESLEDRRGGKGSVSRERQFCFSDKDAYGEYDDDALVALIAEGDQMACRVMVGRYLDAMVALARRFLGNHNDAEDVAQEVFVRLWRQAGRWQPGRAQFSTWLYRVAINLCLDVRHRHRTASLEEQAEPVDTAGGPEHMVYESQIKAKVDEALGKLPERQRAALVLSHHQGLSNRETAEVLEISIEAVESLLSRARRALRQELMPSRDFLLQGSE
ncbi:MAG: RNA polymerase sigma factor [Parvularculales bacterium]